MFLQILKKDLPAGLVIFILSIPLNLGLASALGFSPISGLLSGIAGGFIVGALGSSAVSITAPAIGLTAFIVTSISYLESFQLFQLSLFLAGVFQLVWGFVKAGFISSFFPTSVIRGMIAGVGLVLLLKQIPHAVGFDVEAIGNLTFFEKTGENTFTHILILVDNFLPGPFINAIVSIFILIYWKKIPLVSIRSIPAPVIVILTGLLLNLAFQKWIPGIAIEKTHLINIPPIKWSSYFQNYEILLSFSEIFNYKVWIIGLVIAYLASIETLLSIEAIDRLDPKRRRIHRDKELTAQGVANIILSFFGGIPVATAIVRSSVNIEMKNETKFSGIIHSIFLVLGTFFFIPYLNLIPLSSLAAILIVTGYHLTKVWTIEEIYKKGNSQFIPFSATVLGIIFTDILIGVLIGLVVSIFFILRNNYRSSFSTNKNEIGTGETLRIEMASQTSFLNKGSIQKTLWDLPEKSKVIIDASYSEFIDEDILDVLHEFTSVIAPMKKIQVNLIGLKDNYKLTNNIQFVNVISKEAQTQLRADEILELLKKGNERFINGIRTEKYYKHQLNATSEGQFPLAVVLSCIDSRTSPEIIFDAGIGDILSIRIAGNIVSEGVLGSIEIACSKLDTKLIVVMGHSRCGAIKLAINSVSDGEIQKIVRKIKPAIRMSQKNLTHDAGDFVNIVAKRNVHNAVHEILKKSKFIKENVESGQLKIVSAFFELETGKIQFD